MTVFSPLGDEVTVVESTSSTGAVLPGSPGAGQVLRVYNSANGVCFVRWGSGAQTAVATDTFVAPDTESIFDIPSNVTNVAVILPSGAGSAYFQRGSVRSR